MSRKKGIVISYVFTILNTFIGLFTSTFIIQSVGQADYGVYQAITAFVSYLVLFELGTGNILNRNISLLKKDGTEQLEINKNISTVWSITLVLSAVMLSVSTVFYFLMDTIYRNSLTTAQILFGKPLFILTTLKLVFAFFTQTLNGGLIGFECYSVPKIISLIHLFVRTFGVLFALSIYGSIHLMVAIDTILEIAMFVSTFLYVKIKLRIQLRIKDFDMRIFREAMPLALALLFQSVINMANSTVDKFVISITMSPENVAVYSVAMYIFITFSSLTSLPNTMYMPEIAKNMRSGVRGNKLTETLVQPCRLVVVIGGMLVGGFIAVGRPFIMFMYGYEYMQAWLIAVVIMVPMLINMTNGIVINVLDISNKRLVRSMVLLCTALLNVILTIWWVRQWGMIGAACATAASTGIGFLITNIYYSRVLKLRIAYMFAQSYKGILPCLITATLTAWGMTHLIGGNLGKTLLGGTTFVVVFGMCFLIFGANQLEKSNTMFFFKKIFRNHCGDERCETQK